MNIYMFLLCICGVNLFCYSLFSLIDSAIERWLEKREEIDEVVRGRDIEFVVKSRTTNENGNEVFNVNVKAK